MKTKVLLTGLLLLTFGSSVAQNVSDSVLYTVDEAIPSYVKLPQLQSGNHARRMKAKDVDNSALLRSALNLNDDTSAELVDTLTDMAGTFHQFYSQLYKGVKVEGTRYGIHYHQGVATSLNGNFRTINNLNVSPSIQEDEALNSAIKYIGAEQYAWENNIMEEGNMSTPYPKGQLVIFFKDDTPFLTFRFYITSTIPFSSLIVYVDAHNGNIVDAQNAICNATGTAATRYSGTQQITTSLAEDGEGGYILYDKNRNIRTKKYISEKTQEDFRDNDNNWTRAEYHNSTLDDGALDAHWGLSKVYDFFKEKFGRKGYNNKNNILNCYVGDTSIVNNAYWYTRTKAIHCGVSYNKNPITCLDILTHEYSHAVCSSTSGFTNIGENGALGEGFADIWAISNEHHLYPNDSINPWIIGEDLGPYNIIRNIKNPRCKYYKGKGWINASSSIDDGGTHTNCGVLTYWFYLIVNGGDGKNEINNKYYIDGIGFEKAEKICYNAWTSYLTSSSKYEDARKYTIETAEDLFGEESDEVIAVTNAWYAVGVGTFYDYKCSISGSKLVAKGATATYTIKNATPNVEFDLGGFDLISYVGDKLTVKAKYTARAYINVVDPIYGIIAKQSLWIGPPVISSVMYNSMDNMLEMSFFGGDPQVTSASWSVTGGGYSFYPYTKYVPYQKSGQLDVSVTATNACGRSDMYTCKINLSDYTFSLIQSSDSRTVTLLPFETNEDTNLSIDHSFDYKLIDIRTGNVVAVGIKQSGESLCFSKESSGFYILEVCWDKTLHKTFKITLK